MNQAEVKGIWTNTSKEPQKVTYKKPGENYSVEAEGQTGKPFEEQIVQPNQGFEFTAVPGSLSVTSLDGEAAPAPTPAPDAPL